MKCEGGIKFRCTKECKCEEFDVAPLCGNSFIEGLEACDDGNTVNGDGCNEFCRLEPDRCGDNRIGEGEECDDGNTVSGDGCSRKCQIEVAECGNGNIDEGEECDDGPLNSDSEPSACRSDCRKAFCGDGTVDIGEQCDEGAKNSDFFPDRCRLSCVMAGCGDGVIDEGEECDDGNRDGGDGCSPKCEEEIVKADVCGDGELSETEECDQGKTEKCKSEGKICDTRICECIEMVEAPWCGNSLIEGAEQCDDGGTENGDGCSEKCRLEADACGDGKVGKDEECDDGNTVSGDGCGAECKEEEEVGECGDGKLDEENGEECGQFVPCEGENMACNTLTCLCLEFVGAPWCSNLIIEGAEQCDDGNRENGDGCSDHCKLEPPRCGDGRISEEAGEECDDGNEESGDGCSSRCFLEIAGDGDGDGDSDDDDNDDDDNDDSWGDDDSGGGDGDGDSDDDNDDDSDDDDAWGDDDDSDDDDNDDNDDNNDSGDDDDNDDSDDDDAWGDDDSDDDSDGFCGDGMKNRGEECDDGNVRDNDGCSSTCHLEVGICGDGVVEVLLGEQCEPSLHDAGLLYGCSSDCRFVSASCGDSKVDPGEECDEGRGNSDAPDAVCRRDCSKARCGDGVRDSGEECDDGNRLNGDRCDRFCKVERRGGSGGGGGGGGGGSVVSLPPVGVPPSPSLPGSLPQGFAVRQSADGNVVLVDQRGVVAPPGNYAFGHVSVDERGETVFTPNVLGSYYLGGVRKTSDGRIVIAEGQAYGPSGHMNPLSMPFASLLASGHGAAPVVGEQNTVMPPVVLRQLLAQKVEAGVVPRQPQTGPGLIAVIAGGAALGFGLTRRRKR